MVRKTSLASLVLQLGSGVWLLGLCVRTGIFLLLPEVPDGGVPTLPGSLLQTLVIPTSVMVLASMAGSIALAASPAVRNDTDRNTLPLLLLTIQLCGIWISPVHAIAFGSALPGASGAGMVHTGCMVFSCSVLMVLGLTRAGLNVNKMGWYLMICGSASLLIALLTPKAGPVASRIADPGIVAPAIAWAVRAAGLIAIIGFWHGYGTERSRHNFIRATGMTLIV
jgi:hypothetical protein